MIEKKKRVSWNKGLSTPEEVKMKMRESHNPKSNENLLLGKRFQKGLTPWNKGLKGWNDGHLVTEETKRKISMNHNPKSDLNFEKRFSEKGINNLRIARTGEKNPAWNGGTSYLPYSVEFTKDLRRQIRLRDNYICGVCGVPKSRIVHHIDYDKTNSDPGNLITLCRSCHMKTNSYREEWIAYFKERIAANA